MRSLSILVLVGLILALLVSISNGSPETGYTAEEWERQFDKIMATTNYNDMFDPYLKDERMDPQETHDILVRLAIDVPEKHSKSRDIIESYLEFSRISKEKCSIDYITNRFERETMIYNPKIHIGAYLKHFFDKQLELCGKTIEEYLKKKNLRADDREAVKELFICQERHKDPDADIREELIKGSIDYMKSKLERKDVCNMRGFFSLSKTKFDKHFKELVIDPCERVVSEVWPYLINYEELKYYGLFLAGLKEEAKLMEPAGVCKIILQYKEYINKEAYDRF